MTNSPIKTRGELHLVLMLTLTFSTGIIDAVGYLGLDRVFTGNMTGNVVILGMALLGADNLPVLGPIIALVGFLAGAATAGRVLRPILAGWSQRTTTLLAIVGALILVIAIALLGTGQSVAPWLQYSVTGLLGYAMGMQAGTARHIAVKDVTTVVVTSTLAGLAADSWLAGGSGQPWKRRAGSVVLIGLGALCGAASLHVHIGLGLVISALLTLIVAWAGHTAKFAPDAAAA
ncbi:MAG: hypothetical protein QOD05_2279 [Microbacteriaceae bacterium]|nr:hypothetical protein [Microbacteriaceae bacterium]